MPRVTAPMFSLTASGTLGKRLTFLKTTSGAQVRWNATSHAPRTPAQILHGQRVADCRTTWRNLPAAEKAEWNAKYVWSHLTGPALFMREWFLQNIYPPGKPAQPV